MSKDRDEHVDGYPVSENKNGKDGNKNGVVSSFKRSPDACARNVKDVVGYKEPKDLQREINYLEKCFRNGFLKTRYSISDEGDIWQAHQISGCTFFIAVSHDFSNKVEKGEFPVKVYLGDPNFEELGVQLPTGEIPELKVDNEGLIYIDIDPYERKRILSSYLYKPISFCEEVINYLSRLAVKLGELVSTSCDVDGACRKIVLSDRAFIQIFNESNARFSTETGGLLLGHRDNGVWYVVEASDPGINGVFKIAYHESDVKYQNHVCSVISRLYKHPLVFLGMWHRHPGSLDTFSSTDDMTNYKYACSVGAGCISAIVNYDPNFRITFYYVKKLPRRRVRYTPINIEIGDDKIPNPEITKLCDVAAKRGVK